MPSLCSIDALLGKAPSGNVFCGRGNKMKVDLYRSKKRHFTGLMVPENTNMEDFFEKHPELAEEFNNAEKDSTELAIGLSEADPIEAKKQIEKEGYYIAQAKTETTIKG